MSNISTHLLHLLHENNFSYFSCVKLQTTTNNHNKFLKTYLVDVYHKITWSPGARWLTNTSYKTKDKQLHKFNHPLIPLLITPELAPVTFEMNWLEMINDLYNWPFEARLSYLATITPKKVIASKNSRRIYPKGGAIQSRVNRCK